MQIIDTLSSLTCYISTRYTTKIVILHYCWLQPGGVVLAINWYPWEIIYVIHCHEYLLDTPWFYMYYWRWGSGDVVLAVVHDENRCRQQWQQFWGQTYWSWECTLPLADVGGPVTPLPRQVMADKDITQGPQLLTQHTVQGSTQDIYRWPFFRGISGGIGPTRRIS